MNGNYSVQLAGHYYNLLVNNENIITHCECVGRWTICPVEYTGLNAWELNKLQKAVNEQIEWGEYK